jgi:hypothetical protein
MGYTTNFDGSFAVTPPLLDRHRAWLKEFSRSRRCKWKLDRIPSDANSSVGLGVGSDGGFYVDGGTNPAFADVLDYNTPPDGQPGLWCQWTPTEDGGAIVWDEGEKFYYYVEWLEYLINTFLEPWGYKVNGEVEWSGEDAYDLGKIVVTNNIVQEYKGKVVYE